MPKQLNDNHSLKNNVIGMSLNDFILPHKSFEIKPHYLFPAFYKDNKRYEKEMAKNKKIKKINMYLYLPMCYSKI